MKYWQIGIGIWMLACLTAAAMLPPQVSQAQDAKIMTEQTLPAND
jgi:hypothetical protein